ncbi:MAG TPA: HAMP domain-containing sensor histidine kinase [Acidimicrobiia bacterium]|nr:HAMP domain-containing sensor histidine kinase [Acidimicrobiia bacterium]
MRPRDPPVPAPYVRPHPLWTTTAVFSAALALLIGGWAVFDHYVRIRPVGEGELFSAEVRAAATEFELALEAGTDPALAVRQIRNRLHVETVSVVTGEGIYLHSTSDNLVGGDLTGYLESALARDAFAAIAEPLTDQVSIDGVVEWEAGDVLYRVLAPLPSKEGGLLIEYDISALLGRRASQAALRPVNLAAGAASIVLLGGTVLLMIARQGAQRRATEAALERYFLERRSDELEAYNLEVDRARDEAERALALAEETNRIRSEFVLMINHELRTPLTSIVTGSELLANRWEEIEPEDRQSLLGDVVADGRRLKELITQMLVVARIENRGLQYELRQVPVDTLRAKLEELSPRTPLWPEGQEMPAVLTDADTLAHLLISLADNARTHGATRVDISLVEGLTFEPTVEAGKRPESGIYFLISDNGPGIDAAFIQHIFEKFEKKGRSSGTGLGLYLAKLMVEGIEGSISVVSGPEGTVMAVGVPRWARQQLRVAV